MSKPVEFISSKITRWFESKEASLKQLGSALIILWAGVLMLIIFSQIFTFGTRFEDPTWTYMIYVGLAPIIAYLAFLLIAIVGTIIWMIDLGLTMTFRSIIQFSRRSAAP